MSKAASTMLTFMLCQSLCFLDSDLQHLADPDPSTGVWIFMEQALCGSTEVPDPQIVSTCPCIYKILATIHVYSPLKLMAKQCDPPDLYAVLTKGAK